MCFQTDPFVSQSFYWHRIADRPSFHEPSLLDYVPTDRICTCINLHASGFSTGPEFKLGQRLRRSEFGLDHFQQGRAEATEVLQNGPVHFALDKDASWTLKLR